MAAKRPLKWMRTEQLQRVAVVLGKRCPACDQVVRKQYKDAADRARAWRAERKRRREGPQRGAVRCGTE